MLKSRLMLGAGLAGAFLLCACAKVGNLERPAPLFGDQAKAEYEQQQQQKKAGDEGAPKATQNFPARPAPNP